MNPPARINGKCNPAYLVFWRKKNPNYDKTWYKEHPKKSINWRIKNKELSRKIDYKSRKKAISELSDSYIREALGVKGLDIPGNLIDAKRLQLKIFRLVKQHKQTKTENI